MASSSETQLSLEEQLNELREENRGLREQLSGPDLKVFEQNRQLKRDHRKLTEEIRRLTAECVQLAFRVRELEGNLEEVREEVEQHRSQEVMLSGELERERTEREQFLRSQEELVASLKREHEERLAAREQELSERLAETEQRLQLEVTDREERISSLSRKVDELKEQFLSVEIEPEDDEEARPGAAFRLLAQHLEELLGYPGRTLVEQVFNLCRVDISTEDPASLEDVFEALQDTGTKLVRSQEQEELLVSTLEKCWRQLHGEEAPSLEVAEEESSEESLESSEEEESSEEASEDVVAQESEAEQATEEREPAEEASEEGAAPERAEVEMIEFEAETPETAESEPEPEADVAEPEPSPGEPEAPEAEEAPETEEALEVEAEVEEAEEEVLEAEDAGPGEAAAELEASGADSFEQASTALSQGHYEQARSYFEARLEREPASVEARIGLARALHGLAQRDESYAQLLALRDQDLGEAREQFEEVWESVLHTKLEDPRSDIERKRLLVQLAELKFPSAEAAELLSEAEQIPVRIDEDGLISYKQVLGHVESDDVTPYLLDYMHALGDRPDLFEHLEKNFGRLPDVEPVAQAIVALARSSRAAAQEVESQAGELLEPCYATREMAEEINGEEALVEVFLDHLIPRAGIEMQIPSERFEELLHESEPAAFVGSLRQALRNVDYTIFFEEIEVLSYMGEQDFLVEACPEPTPTLLFHQKVEEVPPEELRFLTFRRLVQMYRRHLHLSQLAETLDDDARCKLVQACVDIHRDSDYDISQEIQSRLQQLSEHEGDRRGELLDVLHRLYEDTGSESFLELGDFLYDYQLMKKWLDPIADHFAASVVGLTTASYATARDVLGNGELFDRLEAQGLGLLWEEGYEEFGDLRLRLQRLWLGFLKEASYVEEDEEE